MMSSPPSSAPRGREPLIFVSDASAEAERITGALREKGYVVVDVPLSLLVGRVAVQRPALILVDVDAEGALATIARLRDVPGGSGVDIIFFGAKGETLERDRDAIFHEGSGFYVRPVDVVAVCRKAAVLVGPPGQTAGGRSVPPPSLRPSMLVPSSRPPGRHSGAPIADVTDRDPPDPDRAKEPPSMVGLAAPADTGGALPGGVSHTEVSPELARLLADAELRVAQDHPDGIMDEGPQGEENDIEAELSPDVLAALEEPLDDADDDAESGIDSHPPSFAPVSAEAAPRSAQTGTASRGPHTRRITQGSMLPASTDEPVTSSGERGRPADASEDASEEETGQGLTEPPPSAGRVEENAPTPVPPHRGRDADEEATPATPASLRGRASQAPPSAAAMTLRDESTVPPRRPEASPSVSPPSLSPPLPSAGAEGAATVPPAEVVDPAQASTNPPRRRGRAAVGSTTVASLPPDAPPRRSDPPTDAGAAGESRDVAQTNTADPAKAAFEIPPALGEGDAIRLVALAIRSRLTGGIAFEQDEGIRRIVMRDGDFVTAASGVHGESLVAFLAERGDLTSEVAAQLAHRLPAFGRHAGAALIARGHLGQDQLWPVLRAHAEWIIGHVLMLTTGTMHREETLPSRLEAEPSVFGGATGAEVFVETTRRKVTPEVALARLDGKGTVLLAGSTASLINETALTPQEVAVIERAAAQSVGATVELAESADFAAVLYALTLLGVLGKQPAILPAPPKPAGAPAERDAIDDEALREQILARRALIEEGDYFALLGVPRAATAYDIKRAYLELRRRYEPSRLVTARTVDLRDDVDVIVEVLDEAYSILRDSQRRERYRRAIEAQPL